MFGDQITLAQAVTVCLFSLAVVFAVLLLLSCLIDLIHWAVGKLSAPPVPAPAPETAVSAPAQADSRELAVLAAAAIAAYLGTQPGQFVVRSICRVPDSGWTLAGRVDSIQ